MVIRYGCDKENEDCEDDDDDDDDDDDKYYYDDDGNRWEY